MSRSFQDDNFLVWEAFASGGEHGFSENAHIIFYCRTDRALRPRVAKIGHDNNAAAERFLSSAKPPELLEILRTAPEIP
jgi:hypothetical protein